MRTCSLRAAAEGRQIRIWSLKYYPNVVMCFSFKSHHILYCFEVTGGEKLSASAGSRLVVLHPPLET